MTFDEILELFNNNDVTYNYMEHMLSKDTDVGVYVFHIYCKEEKEEEVTA